MSSRKEKILLMQPGEVIIRPTDAQPHANPENPYSSTAMKPTAPEVIRLLALSAKGDREAFGKLYLQHRGGLLTFVSRQFPRLAADLSSEDVVADTFAALWQNRRKLSQIRNFRSYILSIAFNTAVDHVQVALADGGGPIENLPSRAPSPSASLEHEEFFTMISKALDALPALHRTALEMKVDGLTAKQISEKQGCTQKAVERRLAKAREQLKRELTQNEVRSTIAVRFLKFLRPKRERALS